MHQMFRAIVIFVLVCTALAQGKNICGSCEVGFPSSIQRKCSQLDEPGKKCKIQKCGRIIGPTLGLSTSSRASVDLGLLGAATGGVAADMCMDNYRCCCETNQEEYCEKNCGSNGMPKTCNLVSVCFAVDESSSIRESGFRKELKFVLDTSAAISALYARNTAYSMVEFNHGHSVTQSLTNNLYGDFVPKVSSAIYNGGGTNINYGLEYCHAEMKKSALKEGRVIILLTDGRGTDGRPIPRQIKQDKIGLMTVGIGNNVDEKYLKSIATSPDYYIGTDLNDIQKIAQKAVGVACSLANSEAIISASESVGAAISAAMDRQPESKAVIEESF